MQKAQLNGIAERAAQQGHCVQSQTNTDEPEEGQDFLQQLKQQGVKDDELGSFLDKLGGAIAPKHVSTLDVKVSLDSGFNMHREPFAGKHSTA